MNRRHMTQRDVEESAKLAVNSTRVTAADLIAWCDRNLDGEQDYNRSMNIGSAKRVIEQAIKDICR